MLHRPQSLLTGMNKFLASLEITFRRDPTNYRPRVNKLNSIKDREQKGTFFNFPRSPPTLTAPPSLRQLLLPRGVLLKVPLVEWGMRHTLLGADLGPAGVG